MQEAEVVLSVLGRQHQFGNRQQLYPCPERLLHHPRAELSECAVHSGGGHEPLHFHPVDSGRHGGDGMVPEHRLTGLWRRICNSDSLRLAGRQLGD